MLKEKKLDEKDNILLTVSCIGNGQEVNSIETWSNISDCLMLAP